MQFWRILALSATAFTMLASSVAGCDKKPGEYPVSPTTPPPIIEPAPVKQNLVVEYASQKDLPQPIIDRLQPLGYDGMNEYEKALIDYLYGISQAEVVSSKVQRLVPSSYQDEVTQSLQAKVVDTILSDGEVSLKEASVLTYLSIFSGETQRELIEFCLDDTLIDFLVLNSSLENQDFAKYAVGNKLCIQDHELTSLEKSFLEKPEEHAQALLDDYLSELSRTYPKLDEELGKLPDLGPETSNNDTVTQESEKVYLLVSSSIYESLKPWTDRWIEDVERTGAQIITKPITKETPDEIRALLQNTPDLTGCLMVGDIPTVKYEMDFILEGDLFHEEFPTDLYYMDLDGDWLDTDNDGIFDTHTGNISPETWVGRLKASGLPTLGDEINLLKNYFDKNHLYRIGALTLPRRALLYVDDMSDVLWTDSSGKPVTYPDLVPVYDKALSSVYDLRVVAEPEVTTATDYLKRLEEGWNLVRLVVHSGGFGHHFRHLGDWDGKVFPEDICRKDPKAFFYTIISCENFDYTRTNYMGGCYVFSKSYSLLAIGDSGIHDVLQVLSDEFFPRLKSDCFGSAFLHYLQECVREGARLDSIHNAIMIGDPLLKPIYNGQDSDGDGLTDQYELSIGLNPSEIDSDRDSSSDLEEAKFIEFLRYNKVYTIEAVEDTLELASSNSLGVKEAFELMIKGGNPYRDENIEIERGQELAKSIKIDGDKADWADLEPICIDAKGDDTKGVEGTDILAVYAAIMDDQSLYILFETFGEPNKDASYVFPIDVNGDGDWDYSVGFTAHDAWFYDLTDYANGEWPEKWESLADVAIAFDEVAEFKMPISKIGNPMIITIYPWVNACIPECVTTDQTASGVVSRVPLMPNWNTELQALFELALDNEFEDDDTTALAIAMADGFFRTIGDDPVLKKVREDDNKMLNLARELTQWQKANGFFPISDLPLEAKVAWAWRGNTSMARGPFNLQSYKSNKLPLRAYEWNMISPDTLRDMRTEAEKNQWMCKNVGEIIATIEDYFFFSGQKEHWFYQTCGEVIKNVDGVDVTCGQVLNADYQFYLRYKLNQKCLGDCQAESVFLDSWAKSLGIASLITLRYIKKETLGLTPWGLTGMVSHNHIIYYEPEMRRWKAYPKQLEGTWGGRVSQQDHFDFWIYKPPVNQVDCLDEWEYRPGYNKGNMYYLLSDTPLEEIYQMFLAGVPSLQMKQWLFYSTAPSKS